MGNTSLPRKRVYVLILEGDGGKGQPWSKTSICARCRGRWCWQKAAALENANARFSRANTCKVKLEYEHKKYSGRNFTPAFPPALLSLSLSKETYSISHKRRLFPYFGCFRHFNLIFHKRKIILIHNLKGKYSHD